MLVVAVALELEHAVDEVLEDARAGDRAVLRHVPDEDRRDAGLLRDAEQAARRLAYLGDRAGRGSEVGGVQRLHRIDHANSRALLLERRAHGAEIGLRQDPDGLRSAEPGGPERDLRRGLLAGDQEQPSDSC